MLNYCKYGIIFFLIYLFNLPLITSQVLNGADDHKNIKAEFVKENVKIEPREPFFNVLKIINTSERKQFVNLRYETPLGWSLISEQETRVNINPNDTVFVPLRASANKKVKGEIGYSIIASLTNRSGDPVTTAYCFIKVPRKSKLDFRPLTRVSYIDQKKKKGSFSFRLINEGNVDEVVYLDFTSTPNISISGEVNDNYSTDVVVPSKTDTTISYNVTIEDEKTTRDLYRVNLTGRTEETRFNTSFWFKNLSNSFEYTKPSNEMPLVLELNMMNLFSETEGYFSGVARGNIFFKNERNFSFYFHKFPSKTYHNNFLQASRLHLDYGSPQYGILAGNRIPFRLRTGYGKGVAFEYKGFEHIDFQGKYTRNEFYPINNYGLNLDFEVFNSAVRFNTNLEYSDNLETGEQTMLGLLGNQFSFLQGHNLYSEVALSSYANNFNPEGNLGWHYRFRYNGRINDLRLRLRNRFDSDDYFGSLYGKNDLHLNAHYNYKKGYQFTLYFRNSKYKPTSSYLEGNDANMYRLQRLISLRTTKNLNNKISVFGYPEYEYFNSNFFYNYNSDNPFITNSYYFRLGGRIRIDNYSRLSTSFKGGITSVSQYAKSSLPPDEIDVLESRNEDFTAVFDLNYYARKWGVFFKYNYGPYNGSQYYTYFYSGNFNQLLRLMPYYRAFVYKDIIELNSRVNYMYGIKNQTHRINWGNEVRFHLDYGFLLRFIGNFTFQSTLGESQEILIQEKQQYTYSNSYFELRVQKGFGWNQPRMKYYDFQINLYKDLNGNLKKDYNEPGIKNVLVAIEKLDPSKIDSIDVDYKSGGNLANNRLLSGMKGTVRYENIPRGVYKIILRNVGEGSGNFSADKQEFIVNIDEDKTISVPYLEKNKIFGKIILNRSKLSNLGEVPVGNIKVTAVNQKGRKISTLTDKNGNFTLYAPNVDLYTVSINNVFKDHFDLRKNDYKVQLNGYKQFEVNFIFDEKRRKINFTPSFQEEDVEVRSVKRTNMTGFVKDENTLQPVRSTIEIVDNTTGSTVETTHSDRETGRFSMSFMTGTNYSMIVTAPGYWFYSEKLNLDQMLTIQDVEKEILLKNIIIGSKIELNNLRFDPGSTEIPNDAYPELDRLIEQLKENPNVRIQISGHSDALETLENEELSVERAKAVAKYMMQNGFSNIEYVGYKDKKPIVPNDSEENRAQNRRVEIIVVDK